MIAHAENVYSFRAVSLLATFVAPSAGPDAQQLAAIEGVLNTAHMQYWQRQYAAAIDSYKQAGTLIYRFLDASAPAYAHGVYDQLSKNPALFDPLLSAASNYMNVLPANAPEALQPHVPVDPALLATKGFFQNTGIRTPALSTRPITNVVASATMAAKPNVLEVAPKPPPAPEIPAKPPAAAPANGARALGIDTGGKLLTVTWQAGSVPALEQLKSVYAARVKAVNATDVLLNPQQPSDVALSLPHWYYYVIPLGIAEALHAMGDYANAETSYFQAASYQYINTAVEVPYVFLDLAKLYLDWGNSLYKQDVATDAAPIYQRLIAIDGSVPTSQLYTMANLKPAADVARTVIGQIAHPEKLPSTINPQLIATILDVYSQLIKIKAGLDWLGMSSTTVPIWTFDYLQSVAINFANFAINAERDFISFQERADQAQLTRTQLQQTVSQAQGEVQAAALQANATKAELTAYQDGVALANLRASNAAATVTAYSSESWYQNIAQAQVSQLQGGDDGDPNLLLSLLSQLQSGQTISDSRGNVTGAQQLYASNLGRDYEIDQLNKTKAEMQSAAVQAQAEANAAQARVAAANAQVTVAQLRVTGAQQMLSSFDSAFFTPDVWHAMGQTMYALSQRYMNMALRVARLMQAEYNFETDQSLALIHTSYGGSEINGVLGADALMADIQTFTYDLVTSHAGKPQPMRHEVSLARSYPFQFETQFRKTGAIDFTTRVEDFDTAYPGTYSSRIDSVEVLVDGIVPVLGIAGTLTNDGVSTYRVPSQMWPAGGNAVKFRIQPKETLVISDYQPRNDALLYREDQRMRRIFEGAGVSSAWRLEIPKSINDVDYGALTDVRIVFYYHARYDDDLRSRVLTHLASLPAVTHRSRSLPLGWLYPDAFFHFLDTGTLTFKLKASDFDRNETLPVLSSVALLVVTSGKPASGIVLDLTTPGKAAASGTTDTNGIAASGGGPTFAGLAGGTAVGDYGVTLSAAKNAGWVSGGKLDLSAIVNVSLIFEYDFTPRS
jgi:hypothetical protein